MDNCGGVLVCLLGGGGGCGGGGFGVCGLVNGSDQRDFSLFMKFFDSKVSGLDCSYYPDGPGIKKNGTHKRKKSRCVQKQEMPQGMKEKERKDRILA